MLTYTPSLWFYLGSFLVCRSLVLIICYIVCYLITLVSQLLIVIALHSTCWIASCSHFAAYFLQLLAIRAQLFISNQTLSFFYFPFSSFSFSKTNSNLSIGVTPARPEQDTFLACFVDSPGWEFGVHSIGSSIISREGWNLEITDHIYHNGTLLWPLLDESLDPFVHLQQLYIDVVKKYNW
jgi:hypothetical protein